METSKREHWGSNLGFILATAGSAIGLGNVWKFPYIAGENGGGAFVLVYLACILVIGLPIMLCEITLGRHAQKDVVSAFNIVEKNHVSTHLLGGGMIFVGIMLACFGNFGWSFIFLLLGYLWFRYGWKVTGMLGVFTGVVILSFYGVVGGWTFGYFYKSIAGELDFKTIKDAGVTFNMFISNWKLIVSLHALFIFICAAIIWKGIKQGIEFWAKILMPVLFLLILIMIVRSVSLPGAVKGVKFFLSPDFSALSSESILIALGHAFFTLSLGMGAIITYGSYLSKKQNIFTCALAIVFLDTLIAIMAGLAIFPAVFAQGYDPASGPGLVFQVLPNVFNSIPGGLGWLWGGMFFLFLAIAALTSGISLLEVAVTYLVDELKIQRHLAIIISSVSIFLLGVLSAISIGNWDRIPKVHQYLSKLFAVTQGSFFDMADNLASNWLLPLGGLLIALFVGWIWGTTKAIEEIRSGSKNFADVHLISLLAGLKDDKSHNNCDYHVWTLAALWGIFIRFVAPVAVAVVFLKTIGWM